MSLVEYMVQVDKMEAAIQPPPGAAKESIDQLFRFVRTVLATMKEVETIARVQAQRIAELEALLKDAEGENLSLPPNIPPPRLRRDN
jgi:hypothetical protein